LNQYLATIPVDVVRVEHDPGFGGPFTALRLKAPLTGERVAAIIDSLCHHSDPQRSRHVER
jgi:hypothetical protein